MTYIDEILERQSQVVLEYQQLQDLFGESRLTPEFLASYRQKEKTIMRCITGLNNTIRTFLPHADKTQIERYQKLNAVASDCAIRNRNFIDIIKTEMKDLRDRLNSFTIGRAKYNLPPKSPFIRSNNPQYIDIQG